MLGMMMMPETLPNRGDVGGGEGGDDYVGGGDGVAVIHGARMVPFHMKVPALIGWKKGAFADTREKSRKKWFRQNGCCQERIEKPSSSVLAKYLVARRNVSLVD